MPPATWAIDRRRSTPRAPALTRPGATIRELADTVGLGAEPDQWSRWLTIPGETVLRRDGSAVLPDQLGADDELAPGQAFEVPNRVLMVWTGDLGWFGRWAVRWAHDRDYFRWRGLCADELILDCHDDGTCDQTLGQLATMAKHRELHGLFITGHGSPWDFGSRNGLNVCYSDVDRALTYRLALVAINACNGGWSKRDKLARGRPEDLECGGRDLLSSSPAAKFHGVRRLMIPQILFMGMDTGHPRTLIRPGEQGTRG